MDVKIIENEFEKLQNDKQNVDMRISQLKEELANLEKNSLIMAGAIQTCAYFINAKEENKATESKETNKK